jgi:hypothetical protein
MLVETVFGAMQQLGKRQMDRPANRGAAMLMGGQHVDDLAARAEDLQNFAMIDDAHIQILLVRGRKVSRPMFERAAIQEDRRPGNGDYFLVTSCRMSICGRPSRRAPIAPPKAFI